MKSNHKLHDRDSILEGSTHENDVMQTLKSVNEQEFKLDLIKSNGMSRGTQNSLRAQTFY